MNRMIGDSEDGSRRRTDSRLLLGRLNPGRRGQQ